jgi:hypothetical protein
VRLSQLRLARPLRACEQRLLPHSAFAVGPQRCRRRVMSKERGDVLSTPGHDETTCAMVADQETPINLAIVQLFPPLSRGLEAVMLELFHVRRGGLIFVG